METRSEEDAPEEKAKKKEQSKVKVQVSPQCWVRVEGEGNEVGVQRFKLFPLCRGFGTVVSVSPTDI